MQPFIKFVCTITTVMVLLFYINNVFAQSKTNNQNGLEKKENVVSKIENNPDTAISSPAIVGYDDFGVPILMMSSTMKNVVNNIEIINPIQETINKKNETPE